ncbi:unnamed protein product [Diatraea saccharalis]|uniref:Uncharacterized protein n=1 Tax=Diatraea saccharalis TaxID=40085 RepID=A0A9N9WBN5_9NEOP|nr:unnamed protein product [Diatraea saccharalis]
MIAVLRNKHVDSCCRTCLNDISSKFYELFNEYQNSMTLAEMLLICTSIMVEKEDRLPKKLCSSCYNCLVSFYDFRIQAENVEAELKLSQVEKMIDEKLNNPEKVSKIEIKVGNTIMDDSYVTDNLENDFHNLDIVKVESQDSFIAHIDNFNSNNILQEKTDNVSNLNSHYGVSEKSIKCKVCDKKFKKLSKLQIHEEKHNRQLYSCNFCSDTFVQKYKLIRHLMKHSQKHEDTSSEINQNNISQSVTCDMCSANFKSVQSLSAHMRVHIQKGRILSCMFCDKVFKKLSHLKRHELTHEINRPFKCDTCPKSFHTESLLNDHMNRHHGVRPHECPLCSKSFCNISSLTTHLKVHTKEKIYLCPTCGKKFDSSSNLGQHMKRHVGLKLFSCDLCPRSFVTKGKKH